MLLWPYSYTRLALIAAIIFISVGVIMSFCCAIVDGLIAYWYIDTWPLLEGMCNYYSSGSGYIHNSYFSEVQCRSNYSSCKMKITSNTCYCCYLYHCGNIFSQQYYYAFTGVTECWDVIHLYHLMWTTVGLNVIGLFLGSTVAANLGEFKDIEKPMPQIAASVQPQPHILYNPTRHMLTYPDISPPPQALPAYPNYLMHMQHNSGFQPSVTPHMFPERHPASNSGLSEVNQEHPQDATQPQPQGASEEFGSHMLTPNAPALYGPGFGFEKPPPYAC